MSSTRTQIHLTAQQRRRLDDLRRRDGRSLADLIRTAVDAFLASDAARTSDLPAVLDATFGRIPDLAVPSRDEWDRA